MAQTTISSNWTGLITTAKIATAINVAGLTLTVLTESHKVQDFAGTMSFCLASIATLHRSKNYQAAQVLLTSCVSVWSIRLASYLLYRVITLGEDKRLKFLFPDRSKGETWLKTSSKGTFPKIFRIINFWAFQTLWSIIGLAPVYMAQFNNQDHQNAPPEVTNNSPKNSVGTTLVSYLQTVPKLSWIGFGLFAFFFGMETVADWQKFTFKNVPENADKFIHHGLYRYCQFPNYFAEIGVWSSIWLASLPLVDRKNWWTVISPMFTWLLLVKMSGIPLLEIQWKKKYGNLPEFQKWQKVTNRLIPWFPAQEVKN